MIYIYASGIYTFLEYLMQYGNIALSKNIEAVLYI